MKRSVWQLKLALALLVVSRTCGGTLRSAISELRVVLQSSFKARINRRDAMDAEKKPPLQISAFIASLRLMLAAGLVAAAPRCAMADDVAVSLVLESAACRVEVERAHGRLLRLLDREGQIDLKSQTTTAENFRLLLPLPEDARH
jgi:hypothetical protein